MQKTTMESRHLAQSDPEVDRGIRCDDQDHEMEVDQQSDGNHLTQKADQSGELLKPENEKVQPILDMGSRWCPQ